MTFDVGHGEAFSVADPVFYESPARWAGAQAGGAFTQTDREPAGWHRTERDADVWVVLVPDGVDLPRQGWKIHVSATPDNAQRLLDTVWAYCLENRVAFKFLRSVAALRAMSLKYAPRSGSGKMITIYPIDDVQLGTVLHDLDAALHGEPGPYILTDLRWRSGPLYIRFGAFVRFYCVDEEGRRVLAITRPDGTRVPDRRRPVFEVPDWVTAPDFVQEALAARDDGTPFPYRIERSLHFSNAGGVYLAWDGDRQVVLKEARPYAGIDAAGSDSVARLRNEAAILQRLAGIPGVPRFYRLHTIWEHEFLVSEHIPGVPLFSWMADNYPLVHARPTAEDVARYTDRVVAIVGRVERAVASMHARGLVFGDLQPNNILVDAADNVGLVDFELAFPAEADVRPPLAFPGFTAPHLRGPAVDRHALAALKLFLFLPLTSLLDLDPGKAEQFVDVIADRFPLPAGYAASIRRHLVSDRPVRVRHGVGGPPVGLTGVEPDWPAAVKSMGETILLSATPDRRDRLFPGDVEQFVAEGAGLSFAHGAAGVLWALDAAGIGRQPDHERWLLEAVARTRPHHPGFYNGLHGIAYVLDHLGHRAQARTLVDRAAPMIPSLRDVSLASGLAGIGLNLSHLADRTGDSALAAAARRIAADLAEAVASGAPHGIDGGPAHGSGSLAGLLRGWSGVGLCLLRASQAFGDRSLLDAAVAAVHRDLDLCLPDDHGALQVDGGMRRLSYLDAGSAGIALVADEILKHRADDRITTSLPGLVRACLSEFVIEPKLGRGRAGILATLARLSTSHPELDLQPEVDRHLRRLRWHAVAFRGRLAFPGDKLRRLSMDLYTGTAGVLLAIVAATESRTGFLPFLDPPAARAVEDDRP